MADLQCKRRETLLLIGCFCTKWRELHSVTTKARREKELSLSYLPPVSSTKLIVNDSLTSLTRLGSGVWILMKKKKKKKNRLLTFTASQLYYWRSTWLILLHTFSIHNSFLGQCSGSQLRQALFLSLSIKGFQMPSMVRNASVFNAAAPQCVLLLQREVPAQWSEVV